MTKSISRQMQDLRSQAEIVQRDGILYEWELAKVKLDALYAMADDVEKDIHAHPAMPADQKEELIREIENAVWSAYLPVSLEIKKYGELGANLDDPKKWARKIKI